MDRRHSGGFTLLELLVVCALLGVLVTAAHPVVTTTLENSRLKSASSLVVADLRAAQLLAQREGRRVRLVVDRPMNSYRVEVALTGSATDACSLSPDYSPVRTQALGHDYKVVLSAETLDCIIFEPTGRVGVSGPAALTTHTDAASQGDDSWIMYTNGQYGTPGTNILFDPHVIRWINKSDVIITIDLGQARYLEAACPQMLEQGAGVPFPKKVIMAYSTVLTYPPPARNDPSSWAAGSTRSRPYPIKDQTPSGSWRRACPSFEVNRIVRYLKFTFDITGNPIQTGPLAIDEIVVDPASITLRNESGRGSRKIVITPVTGRVKVQ